MVLRTYKGHFTDVSLKNNTPVNTEVLWGGGLWWGLLRASAPTAHHVQEVFDVDDAVVINVGIWIIAPHVLLMSSLGSPFAAY